MYMYTIALHTVSWMSAIKIGFDTDICWLTSAIYFNIFAWVGLQLLMLSSKNSARTKLGHSDRLVHCFLVKHVPSQKMHMYFPLAPASLTQTQEITNHFPVL